MILTRSVLRSSGSSSSLTKNSISSSTPRHSFFISASLIVVFTVSFFFAKEKSAWDTLGSLFRASSTFRAHSAQSISARKTYFFSSGKLISSETETASFFTSSALKSVVTVSFFPAKSRTALSNLASSFSARSTFAAHPGQSMSISKRYVFIMNSFI